MSIVYSVTLVSEIEVVFDYPTNPVIDTTVNSTSLMINAENSFFVSSPEAGNNGLTYRWECTNGL